MQTIAPPHVEDLIANGLHTMVVASGGLDSAYTMWRIKSAGLTVGVHHIVIPELGDLTTIQRAALKNQCDYLSIPEDLRFETTIVGAEGRPFGDHALANILTIPVAQCNAFKAVACGDDLEWRSITGPSEEEKYLRYRLFASDKNLEFAIGSNLDDLLASYKNDMPADFAALTWSCREPVVENGVAHTCRSCDPCQRNARLGLEALLENTVEI